MSRVRQVALPPAARALTTLPALDYHDAFLVDTGQRPARTAEQWARAVLEEAPAAIRESLVRGWRGLGLRLGSTPPERFILGWEVRRSTPEVALLAAGSRIGMPAELLFLSQPGALLFATFVQQTNRATRALWAAVAPFHRQVVPRLLDRAVTADVQGAAPDA